jgi:thioredoxin
VEGTIIEGDPDRLNQILETRKLVLVDFWAEWCGPCIMMNDPLKRLAASEKANCTIVKIDTMKHGSIAGQYHVKGLPTLLLFENNREVKRHAGALTFHQLLEFVNQ